MKNIAYGIIGLVLLDLLILFAGLAQVALGETPYFNEFWASQARFLLEL